MRTAVLALLLLAAASGCVADTMAPAAPSADIHTDTARGRIVFENVSGRLEWQTIVLRVHDCGPEGGDKGVVIHAGLWSPFYNQTAGVSGLTLNEPDFPGSCSPGIDRLLNARPGDVVHDGDFVEVCAEAENGAHDLGIGVAYAPTNTSLGSAFFSYHVRRCS